MLVRKRSSPVGWQLAMSFLLTLLVAPGLRAQDRFWDPARTTGDWNTTTAIWGTSAGGPFTAAWVNGASPSLNAAPGGSTATLTAAVTTSDLFFFSGSFTIAAGSGSLTVADSAFILNSGTGSTNNLIINTPVLGAAFIEFANTGAGSGMAGVYLNADNSFSFAVSVNSNTRLAIGTADPGVGPVRSGTLAGDVSVTFGSVLSFQSTQTYTGVVTGFTTSFLEVVSPPAGATTLTLTRLQNFGGTVQLGDNSTLALLNNGTNTFGSLEVASRISLSRNATLDVTGHTSSIWTLPTLKTLVTAGTTATNGGRILGPARIEGTLDLTGEVTNNTGTLRQEGGNLTIAGGATWRTNITSWTGTTPGTDFGQIVGVGGAKLDLGGASSANRITLDIRGHSLTGFDPFVVSSWTVADFSAGNSSGGILDFASDKFLLDTSSFGQDLEGGSFTLTTDASSNNMTLRFTPVPESAVVLGVATAGLGIIGLARSYFLQIIARIRRHGWKTPTGKQVMLPRAARCSLVEWRRRELNPGPAALPCRHLRV